jgi:hypothetical protein
MNPDDVGRAARRIAAKMVADEAADIMVAITGLDTEGPVTDETAMVVVCRRRAADKLFAYIKGESKSMTTEVIEHP